MTLDETVQMRLAFIKHMYNIAVEQSQKPEPFSSISILTFHDAIDLFFGLSLEVLNIHIPKNKKIFFMDYWDYVPQLTSKVAMQSLNDTRISLKHRGIIPSKLTVETNRERATQFLDEHTRKIFGIEFRDISLIDMIKCDEVKKNLKESEQMLEKGEIKKALSNVGHAFVRLIDDYEDRKRSEFGRSPFSFGESMIYLSGFDIGLTKDESFDTLSEFIDKVKDSVEALQNAVNILSLGINYRRYSKFRLLTPRITRMGGGRYHDHGFHLGSRGIPTAMMLDSALIL